MVNTVTEEKLEEEVRVPLLLLNISFKPGHCLERIRRMKNPVFQDMALTEYYYFSCQHERAVTKAVSYLHHEDAKIQIGAWLIYMFGNMALGNTEQAREGNRHLRELLEKSADVATTTELQLLFSAVKIMLHIPIPQEEQEYTAEALHVKDEGGRLLGCYLMEQEFWKRGEYERVIGAVDASLFLSRDVFPLFFLYLYLTAAMASVLLKDIERAEDYFDKAWKLVKADGFYGPVGELHGQLQIFLEKKTRKEDPEAYKKIMEITHQYRTGWQKMVGGESSSNLLEELTGMEYAVAQLAGLEWSNQEIADYLEITVRTVKYHMTSIFNKLNIGSRKELIEKLPH